MAQTVPPLVGTAEVAEILGIHAPSVTRLMNAGKMPRAVCELAATPVWLREDIEHLRDTGEANGSGRLVNLVGTREAAELLDVNRSQIGRWRRSENNPLPEPVQDLRAGPVWLRADIARFARSRRTP